MSDAPNPGPAAASGATPDAMQELNLLAEEVRQMKRSADRAWKTTAIGFAILICAIGGYLHFLVYRPLKELLTPDVIVQKGFEQVDGVLGQYGIPPLDSGRVPECIGTTLKNKAPAFFHDTVKPAVEELKKDLPAHRQQLTDKFRENAPQFFDDAADKFIKELLPQTRHGVVEHIAQNANGTMDVLDAEIDKAVAQVLFERGQDLHLLKPENVGLLQARIESALEREMGPVIDPIFGGIAVGIEDTKTRLAELVDKHRSDSLTNEEKLEIRLVKLTFLLFKDQAIEHEETVKKILAPVAAPPEEE